MYEKETDENKRQRWHNNYVKAHFLWVKLFNEEYMDMFGSYKRTAFVDKAVPIKAFPRSYRSRLILDLKVVGQMEAMLNKVCQEMGIPVPLSEESLEFVARMEEPIINPIHLIYRYAKVYWLMNRCYASDLYKINDLRQQHPDMVAGRQAEYEKKAITYCQWTLDIRHKRKNHGIPDAYGNVYELILLSEMLYYSCDNWLSELVRLAEDGRYREPRLQYYLALALIEPYHETAEQMPEGDMQRTKKLLQELLQGRDKSMQRKARQVLQEMHWDK